MNGKIRGDNSTHHGGTAPGGADKVPIDHSGKTDAEESAAGDGVAAGNRLEAENAELKDRLLRALAEAENTRRRAERDLNDMRQYAITNFAGDMLNVADNLERAIAAIPADIREGGNAVKTLIEGVKLTETELQRSLERHGVKKLEPMGERFDPNFHEAVLVRADPSVPSGTVNHVLQSGYAIGSRTLRPAKVAVSSGGPIAPANRTDAK